MKQGTFDTCNHNVMEELMDCPGNQNNLNAVECQRKGCTFDHTVNWCHITKRKGKYHKMFEYFTTYAIIINTPQVRQITQSVF